ncbi:MAG: hypothetical protein WA908_01610 [Pontixanthobacter sp.]
MTKRRAPLSIDAALTTVAGQMPGGFAELAGSLDKSESLVRKWADPDTREEISFSAAIAADLIYRAEGGEGAPMFECYAHQLDQAGAMRFADEIALGEHVQTVIRESAEANAAIVAASQAGSSHTTRAEARREVEESMEAHRRALQLLDGGSGDVAHALNGTSPQKHSQTTPKTSPSNLHEDARAPP